MVLDILFFTLQPQKNSLNLLSRLFLRASLDFSWDLWKGSQGLTEDGSGKSSARLF